MSCPPDSLFAPQSYGPAEGAETTEERKRREEEERLARERAERAKRERLCPACCRGGTSTPVGTMWTQTSTWSG